MPAFSNVPNWTQALAALAIVGLTAWTLKVLRRYANDTRRIADDSASQTERAQMPCLAVTMKEPDLNGRFGGYTIENQGFGPALNVLLVSSNLDGARVQKTLASLAVGGCHYLDNEISTSFGKHAPIEIEYTSLSGRKYQTTVAMVNNQMQTEFKKL